MINPTRRRLLVSGAALGGALFMPHIARAQSRPVDRIRIGVITPSSTGLLPVFTPGDDLIGDAGRQGALMADGAVGEVAAQAGIRLDLMPSNAPTSDTAFRVVQRFVETDSVDAIIGGVGNGHAETISAIAEQAGIPFFNVASPNLELRRNCPRYTFHIDASAAMYIDALVLLGASQGYRRYFVVHENTPAGDELRQRAAVSVERLGGGATVVGAAAARPEEPFYGPQLTAADEADADVILLLIGDVDQLVFTAQEQSLEISLPLLPLPYPNTQTREYVREVRQMSPETNPDFRVTLWDASLAQPAEAAEFNNRYIRQWGAPAEAPAWAAYHAVKIIVDTVIATGSTDPEAFVDYLESSGAEFDVTKGTAASFRPWDHQLRQPLYVIRVDQESVWDWEFPTTHVALANVVGELPNSDAGNGDPTARLDVLGDGPEAGDCRLR
jgi:ABC-type branched-subunit amino acid transport system substrate-binding protein